MLFPALRVTSEWRLFQEEKERGMLRTRLSGLQTQDIIPDAGVFFFSFRS